MNAYEKYVVVLVNELDDLLHIAVEFGSEQAPEFAYAVIDMDDIISYFELP